MTFMHLKNQKAIFQYRIDNRFLLVVVFLLIIFPIVQLELYQSLFTIVIYLLHYFIGKRVIDLLQEYVPNYFLYLGLIFSISSILLPIFIMVTTIYLNLPIYFCYMLILIFIAISGVKNGLRFRNNFDNITMSNIFTFIISIFIGIVPIIANLHLTKNLFGNNFFSLHPDLLTFETISNSITKFGLKENYFATGFELKYHWMAYLWAGSITQFADLPPFFSLIKLLPLFSLVCGTLIIFGILKYYKQDNRTFLISALLYSISVYILLKNGSLLNFDSPSQSLTSVWALGFFSITLIERSEKFSFDKLILLSIFILGIAIGKPSFLVPLFGGILFYLLYGLKNLNRSYISYAFMYVFLFVLSLYLISLFLLGNTSAIGGLEIGINSPKIPFILLGQPENILKFLGIMTMFLIFISPKFLWILYLPLLLKNYFKITLFTLGSFLSTMLFILTVGDSSFSKVNLMWFILSASCFSLPLMSITSNIVATKLMLQKKNLRLITLSFAILFSIFINSNYSIMFLNQDLLLIILTTFYIFVIISMLIISSLNQLKSITFIVIISASIFSRLFSTQQLSIDDDNDVSFVNQDTNNYVFDSNSNKPILNAALFLRSNKSLIGEKIATNLDENYLLTAVSRTQFHNSSYDSLFLIGTGITVDEIDQRRIYFQNLFDKDNSDSISYFCSNRISFILTDMNKLITNSIIIKRFSNLTLSKLSNCKY
jgi:hypothetical protein